MRADPPLALTCCLRRYPFTDPIREGRVTIPGVALNVIEVKPHVAAYRRMIRGLEFDLCELAPTAYLIARAQGAPIRALPVFFVRRFHTTGVMVRDGSGIRTPRDLEGRRFGVRAWSVTTGVWKRGVLQNEHGVDLSRISWVVDDEDHVTALPLPPNVQQAPAGQSLVSMFARGALDAGLAGDAGLGRTGKPTEDWKTADTPLPAYHELFPDPDPLDRAYFARTGILPMHGCLAVREQLLIDHPDLARRIFDAFVAAKAPYLAALRDGTATGEGAAADRRLMDIVGGDPLPYGLEVNRTSIEGVIGYAHQQGLIPHRIPAEAAFESL